MKPRTRYEKQVSALNEELTPISQKAVEWAVRNVVEHISFRTSGHKCTCGGCGNNFDHEGKGKYARCPICNGRLNVVDTLKRKAGRASYFSTTEAVSGLQVLRVYLLKMEYKKGRRVRTCFDEVCRLWLNAEGRLALTSVQRNSGYYFDSFCWATDIELRNMTEVHWVISNTHVYSRYSAIPKLRRNGLKGKLPDCHPARLMQAVLTDSRIETMMKSKDYKAAAYFVSRPSDLSLCWPSYKIAARHSYMPEDYSLWCDTIRLLDRCGKDIRSVKYICPTNLKTAHNHWLKKLNDMEERRRRKELMEKAKADEAEFYRQKSCFFGIVITDNELEISVLNSLEAYKEEGIQMKHCVFQCEYYAKADTLILSAHDHQGHRYETVEFSLTEGKVIQSRGVRNTNTEYHDRIIELVNDNAYLFMEAKKSA